MSNNKSELRMINCLRCDKLKSTVKKHTKFCSTSCRVQYFIEEQKKTEENKFKDIINEKDNRIKELEAQLNGHKKTRRTK